MKSLMRCWVAFIARTRTYTAEDVWRFSCHGGPLLLQRILRLLLTNGARLAEAGRFTLARFPEWAVGSGSGRGVHGT